MAKPHSSLSRQSVLRIGFIPLCDAAPLIVAAQTGLFRAAGLRVELSREIGWASIYEKLLRGELDFAHALGPMPIAAGISSGGKKGGCKGLMVLNRNGNGITLSQRLREEGVVDSASFADYVFQRAWEKPAALGIVAPYSSHARLFREWLAPYKLKEGRHYHLATIPPQQFLRHLEAGTLLGACVGEPWNSIAVSRGLGFCVAVSTEIAPGHPEKVLACHGRHCEPDVREDTLAAVTAILEACRVCATPDFLEELVQLVGKRHYLNLPTEDLRRSFEGSFDRKFQGETPQPFVSFYGAGVNAVSPDDRRWLAECVPSEFGDNGISEALLAQIYPPEVFKIAHQRLESQKPEIPAYEA
ncbi:MAG: CmpA/NrtA family ABC transporter substrate-binding protein [Opitutales bacterium]